MVIHIKFQLTKFLDMGEDLYQIVFQKILNFYEAFQY